MENSALEPTSIALLSQSPCQLKQNHCASIDSAAKDLATAASSASVESQDSHHSTHDTHAPCTDELEVTNRSFCCSVCAHASLGPGSVNRAVYRMARDVDRHVRVCFPSLLVFNCTLPYPVCCELSARLFKQLHVLLIFC